MAPYPKAHGALPQFAGDFGHTALSSLQLMPPISESRPDREDAEDGAHGFSSLSEKTRMSHSFQIS